MLRSFSTFSWLRQQQPSGWPVLYTQEGQELLLETAAAFWMARPVHTGGAGVVVGVDSLCSQSCLSSGLWRRLSADPRSPAPPPRLCRGPAPPSGVCCPGVAGGMHQARPVEEDVVRRVCLPLGLLVDSAFNRWGGGGLRVSHRRGPPGPQQQQGANQTVSGAHPRKGAWRWPSAAVSAAGKNQGPGRLRIRNKLCHCRQ